MNVTGLGHVQRAILVFLLENPSWTGADMIRARGETPGTDDQVKYYVAMRSLRNRNLVQSERRGRIALYRLTDEGVQVARQLSRAALVLSARQASRFAGGRLQLLQKQEGDKKK